MTDILQLTVLVIIAALCVCILVLLLHLLLQNRRRSNDINNQRLTPNHPPEKQVYGVESVDACAQAVQWADDSESSNNVYVPMGDQREIIDCQVCPCGSKNIINMECGRCHQAAKGCHDCHLRLSRCACDDVQVRQVSMSCGDDIRGNQPLSPVIEEQEECEREEPETSPDSPQPAATDNMDCAQVPPDIAECLGEQESPINSSVSHSAESEAIMSSPQSGCHEVEAEVQQCMDRVQNVLEGAPLDKGAASPACNPYNQAYDGMEHMEPSAIAEWSFSCPVCGLEASACLCIEGQEYADGEYTESNDGSSAIFRRIKEVASKDVRRHRSLPKSQENQERNPLTFERINQILTKKEKMENRRGVPELGGVSMIDIKDEIQRKSMMKKKEAEQRDRELDNMIGAMIDGQS